MTLTCTKCDTGNRIEYEGKDLHCKFCGNVVTDGVRARWPIVEKESIERAGAVTRMPIGQENSQSVKKATALRNNRQSGSACDVVSTKAPDLGLPDVIAQSGSPSPGAQKKKEDDMSKCKMEGCTKNLVSDGLCYAHYRLQVLCKQCHADLHKRVNVRTLDP